MQGKSTWKPELHRYCCLSQRDAIECIMMSILRESSTGEPNAKMARKSTEILQQPPYHPGSPFLRFYDPLLFRIFEYLPCSWEDKDWFGDGKERAQSNQPIDPLATATVSTLNNKENELNSKLMAYYSRRFGLPILPMLEHQ
jgi:hypothetical protein